MDRGVRASRVRIHDASPDPAAETAYCLSGVPLARDFDVLSEACLEIGVQRPTLDGWKDLVPLVGAVSAKADGEWKLLVRGSIERDPSSDGRRAGCFSRGCTTALEDWWLLRERIKNAAFQHQRGRGIQMKAMREFDGWCPNPKVSRPGHRRLLHGGVRSRRQGRKEKIVLAEGERGIAPVQADFGGAEAQESSGHAERGRGIASSEIDLCGSGGSRPKQFRSHRVDAQHALSQSCAHAGRRSAREIRQNQTGEILNI